MRLKLASILVGLIISLFLLATLEIGARVIFPKKYNQTEALKLSETLNPPFYHNDPARGLWPTPNSKSRATLKSGERIIFDVEYLLDGFARRITPNQSQATRTKYLLFFGCSFTFGHGLRQNETLPYFTAQMLPQYKVYNYAMAASGPSNILVRLNELQREKEVKEKEGILIYPVINDHFRRLIGPASLMNSWLVEQPYLTTENDKVILKGSFRTGRPILTKLYAQLGKSALLRHFNVDFPPRYRGSDYYWFAKVMAEIRDTYQKKFGNDQFYVLIWPYMKTQQLIPALEKYGIKYLDYSKLDVDKLLPLKDHGIEYDGHPTSALTHLLATQIAKDFNEQKSLK
jgi:hypothetical protein